jgi:Cysteine rich repeat
MFGKLETGERQSAGAAVDSDDRLNEHFQPPSPQPKPGEDLHEVMVGIGRRLDDESLALQTIYDRLLAIENQTKKRSSRGFSRYLLAICVGAAAALAWLSYGEAAKQIIATRGPELGWSPETKQMIANWVQQFGWTKPGNGPERIAVSVPEAQVATVAQTVPAAVTPPTPSIDSEQVHQIAADLAALEQTVDQLAASQDKIGRSIDGLQGAVAEILVKIPQPSPPPIAAAPAVAGRPVPGGTPHSENTQNTAAASASLPVGHDVIDGALRASCGPDVQKLCAGILRENGSVIKCLSSHRMELSPTCDAYFNQMPVHRAAQKGAPKVTNPNR